MCCFAVVHREQVDEHRRNLLRVRLSGSALQQQRASVAGFHHPTRCNVRQQTASRSAAPQHTGARCRSRVPHLTIIVILIAIPHHTTTVLRPFFRDHPGEPVPENFWTLWCKGRLTEADTTTVQMGATPSRLTSAHLHHPLIIITIINN